MDWQLCTVIKPTPMYLTIGEDCSNQPSHFWPELINDLKATDPQVRNYIAEEIAALLKDEMIDYAVQGMVVGGAARQQVVFNRLEAIEALSGT